MVSKKRALEIYREMQNDPYYGEANFNSAQRMAQGYARDAKESHSERVIRKIKGN